METQKTEITQLNFRLGSNIQSLIDDELRATANAIVSTVNSIILFLALPAFGYGLSYILQ